MVKTVPKSVPLTVKIGGVTSTQVTAFAVFWDTRDKPVIKVNYFKTLYKLETSSLHATIRVSVVAASNL